MQTDLANNNTISYGSNWMQMSLDDDSDNEGIHDPCKELTDYLESKHKEQKEGLVEWWGVSGLAYHHNTLLTDPCPMLA
jgi:hypothetical protein